MDVSMVDGAPADSGRLQNFGLREPLGRARRGLFASARRLLDLVYPPACLICQKRTGDGEALCAECWSSLSFIERPFCERLGAPFAQDLGGQLISPEAYAEPPVVARARAVVCYEGPARQLVARLKYGDRVDLARPMARWMARAGAELLAEADIIIPVPLHRTRLVRRRFNQAAVLAQAIAKASGVPSDPFALERRKPTPPQVGLSRRQRTDNMQGAFRVPDRARFQIIGRRALLIDDVLTSGATTNSAARALLNAGAARVDALVFARVVGAVQTTHMTNARPLG